MTYRVLDLFSGIGGFSLGLERTGGFRTVAFCEIDPFCQKVLAKHWPDVPCHGDIETREFIEGEADVITGGFPCQDISFAGRGAGLAGERSGLYRHIIRAARVVRPKYIILENVAALLTRGLGVVLGDLASIGYHTESHCIPASAVGAAHNRDRVWIVAYTDCFGDIKKSHFVSPERLGPPRRRNAYGLDLAECGPWSSLPNILRVDYGIPGTLDRLRSLGNSIVPQIAELIGHAIINSERAVA